MKALTLNEAINQGYKYVGTDRSEQFQSLLPIEDLSEEDFEEDKTYWLAGKEVDYVPSITAKDIADIMADHLESQNGNDTGDDTEDVYRIVKKLDFTATAEMINKALENKKYYKLTDIRLTLPTQAPNKESDKE